MFREFNSLTRAVLARAPQDTVEEVDPLLLPTALETRGA